MKPIILDSLVLNGFERNTPQRVQDIENIFRDFVNYFKERRGCDLAAYLW